MTKKYKIVNYIGGKKSDEYIYKTDKLNNSIKKYKIVNYIGGKIPDEYSYITDKFKNDIKKFLEIIFKKKEFFDLIINTIINKIPKEKEFIRNRILSNINYDKIKKQMEITEKFDKKITDVLGALLTVYLKIKNNTSHEVNTSDVKSIIESLNEFLLFILDIGFVYRSIIKIGLAFIKINENILQENININKTFFNNFDLKKFFDLTYSKIISTETEQKKYSDKILEVLNEIINEKEIPKEINTNTINIFLQKVFDDYKEDQEIHKILQDPNIKPILVFFYYNVLPIDFVPEEYKEQVNEHRLKTSNLGILIKENTNPYNETSSVQKLEELEKKLVEIKVPTKSIKDPDIFKKTPKVEPSKVEPSKVEPSKVEPSKVESSKVESSKVEPSKVEKSKVAQQPKTEEQKEDRKKRVNEFKQMSEDEKLEFIKKKESQSSTSQTSTSSKKKWDEMSDSERKIILQKQTEKKEKKAEPKPVAKPKQEPVAKPKQEPVAKPKQEPVAKPKQEPSKPKQEPAKAKVAPVVIAKVVPAAKAKGKK